MTRVGLALSVGLRRPSLSLSQGHPRAGALSVPPLVSSALLDKSFNLPTLQFYHQVAFSNHVSPGILILSKRVLWSVGNHAVFPF